MHSYRIHHEFALVSNSPLYRKHQNPLIHPRIEFTLIWNLQLNSPSNSPVIEFTCKFTLKCIPIEFTLVSNSTLCRNYQNPSIHPRIQFTLMSNSTSNSPFNLPLCRIHLHIHPSIHPSIHPFKFTLQLRLISGSMQ